MNSTNKLIGLNSASTTQILILNQPVKFYPAPVAIFMRGVKKKPAKIRLWIVSCMQIISTSDFCLAYISQYGFQRWWNLCTGNTLSVKGCEWKTRIACYKSFREFSRGNLAFVLRHFQIWLGKIQHWNIWIGEAYH